MKRVLVFLAVLFGLMGHAFSQESVVPDRRVVTNTGQDFYGSDIGSIFETTFRKCREACQANPACMALTFNTRAEACFLKSGVERVEAFDGAVSARMVDTDDATRARATERFGDIDFLPMNIIRSARTLAGSLGGRVAANGSDVDAMRRSAAQARKDGNYALAAQHMSAAVTVSDAAGDWAELSSIWAATKADKNSVRRRLQREALWASVNAYLRAGPAPERATILFDMARRLEKQGRGRDMIPVLRLSQNLAQRRETEERLAYAISNYGFRVTGHTVDSDPAAARMCMQFSEALAEAGVDYSPYVVVAGNLNLPIEAKGQDLCVDGLAHGETYKMLVRQGLPSGKGEKTLKDFEVEAYVRDRTPKVHFASRAYVLPKSSDASIPVVTVNLSEVEIAIHRIGERNLVPMLQNETIDKALSRYMENNLRNRTGVPVWKGVAEITNKVNADVVTALPIGDAVQSFEPGIYAMTARVPGDDNNWDRKATQWFIVTDLGLATMSGADGVHGFVRSLSGADPVPGAKVKLVARNNEVLGEAMTDQSGYVRFAPGLARGKAGMAPAMLTVDHAGDFAFLNMAKPGFDLSDRGVQGRAAPGPVDVFASTERGVYRPGEVVHLTALTRDGAANAIADLPLTAIFTRPDGVEYHRTLLVDHGAGGRSHSLRLGGGVPRGTWNVKLFTDPNADSVKQLSFLVEDFVPERIDYSLDAPEGMVRPEVPFEIALNAQYLYGAPGADLSVGGEVRLTTTDTMPAYKGFRFGLAGEENINISDSLPNVTTDANGDARFELPIPDAGDLVRPRNLTAIVNVTDSSGRPVERTLQRPLAPGSDMIGIRPLFDGQAEEGGPAEFEIIAVGPDGERRAMPRIGWTLSRINRRWQWYEINGRWNWESTTSRERVANGSVSVGAGGRTKIGSNVEWGEYELKLVDLDSGTTASSHRFYAGWYTGGASTDTPDVLEVGLDKDAYAIGETVSLRLKPRHAGKVLLSVIDNRLIEMKTIDVQKGETTVNLTVSDDWGPGAYITATLIRPMDTATGRNPSRALGLAWAAVDPGDRKLDLSFMTPDEVAPRGPLDASVQLAGLPAGQMAYVTVAAVDLGILNLTGFKTPAPDKHYFGQRALGMEMRDLYGQLIDGNQGVAGRLRSGGDAEAKRLKSTPPVEELVAYFSGTVPVGPDGVAKVAFEVPDFNGTVRLMAIAWTDTAVGHAEKDILVRDPIVVSAATPRFMSPRDQTRVLLDVAHATGPTGPVSVSVEGDGGLSIGANPAPFDLTQGQIRRVSLPITAVEIGNPKLRIRTRTPGGQDLLKTLTLPVRLNDPETSRQNRIALPTGGRLVVDANTFAGFEPGTGRATLGIGPVAQFDAPGLLRELDRYPYGCTEQTTSRALPLLYLNSVAEGMGLAQRKDIDDRIAGAIERVLERQSSAGSFGLWRPSRGDLWLDSYVTDFLSRAKQQGHTVPKVAFRSAIDNLRSSLGYSGDFESGGEDIAYALLVLAREGAASIGDLRYYADAKAENFATPLARAQLGAALAFYGEQQRADKMFRLAEVQVLGFGDETRSWRADYGSYLRDGAAVVALAAEAKSTAINAQKLVDVLAERRGRWTSTQEKVWMLLATHAMMDQIAEGLVINGQPATGPMIRLFDEQALGQGPVIVENTGQRTVAMLTTFGVPTQPEPAGGNGYAISRAYYTTDGVEVSPSQVSQNDRLVVVVTVRPSLSRAARLMVDDPLPAGFEIDNPNLLQSGSISAMDWLKTSGEVQNAEFRTERFLAAVDHNSDTPFNLAYIVRAVSPGTFRHSAAVVEDMYRPEYRAWTDTGTVTVVEGQ